MLHQCDAVKAFDTQYIRRKTGPNKDNKKRRGHTVCAPQMLRRASHLSLLPPLDVNNVDFAHLLGEMRAVRAKMATLRESVAGLQTKEVPPAEWPPLDVSPSKLTTEDMRPLRVQLPPKQSAVFHSHTEPKKLYSASVADGHNRSRNRRDNSANTRAREEVDDDEAHERF